MSKKILINAIDPEECRIAIVTNGMLENFIVETAGRESTRGNIYKGVVARVEPSLQAAFVNYGAERHGFLQQQEIHSDYFHDDLSKEKDGPLPLQKIIKPGQEVIVQITKDEMQKKGAMLTTYVSLPGRHMVLMPGRNYHGISRKIEDEKERQRLKEIIDSLEIPKGFGTIVRTAGDRCNKSDLNKDIKYLFRLWKNIKKKAIRTPAPCLLYKVRHLAIRSIRDYFTPQIDEILVDDTALYQDIKDFMNIISPRHTKIVKLYEDGKPLFSKYQLEEQIATVFENQVHLKSGGHIVINPTEALVAIDVNSGKSTRETSIEETAFKTNLEAAAEIARQIRLRNLGGLIVVDFIAMRDKKHIRALEKAMRDYTKQDKARINIGKISKFGLLEMSRQRLHTSVELVSFTPCPYCHGKGIVPSVETLALGFLRKLRLEILKTHAAQVKGTVPLNVADYLLNKKRKELLDIESNYDVTVIIEGDTQMLPGQSSIVSKKN
nr:Rne/Rng family ribonuclease [Desulfobacterales bacterium]